MGAGPDELRVSVVGGHDRVDLVVPAAVRVAELLPELVGRVGRGDPLGDLDEVRLSVLGGARLDSGAGLADQGVPDGAVLTVTAPPRGVPPVDDDLAAVVADAVETVPRPAGGLARRAALTVAVGLLGLAAGGVAASGSVPAAVVAGLTSLGLLGAALVVARVEGPAPVVAAAGWLAVLHAGAAGLAAGVVAAGVASLVAGGAAALASRRSVGPQLWAAAAAGVAVAVAGLVADLAPAPVPVTLTSALVVVVATGDLQPWLAATLAGLVPPPLGEQPPTAPDRVAVAHAVRRAHDVLLVSAARHGAAAGGGRPGRGDARAVGRRGRAAVRSGRGAARARQRVGTRWTGRPAGRCGGAAAGRRHHLVAVARRAGGDRRRDRRGRGWSGSRQPSCLHPGPRVRVGRPSWPRRSPSSRCRRRCSPRPALLDVVREVVG